MRLYVEKLRLFFAILHCISAGYTPFIRDNLIKMWHIIFNYNNVLVESL